MRKAVSFVGSSLDDLRGFPQVARQRVGYQLHLVQHDQDPADWKPMPSIGPGCREIRVRDETSNADRVFYVATVADVVYVLHCFQKKTRQTAKSDVDLGKQRYRETKDVVQGGTP